MVKIATFVEPENVDINASAFTPTKNMIKYFLIFFSVLLATILLISCTNNQAQQSQWTKAEVKHFLDSAHVKKLIASYNESDAYCLIIKNDPADTAARKVSCIPGFPLIVDTLIQIGNNAFKSRRRRTLYKISDEEVLVTYFQKIIHPSSNWQGQTPWQEIILVEYPRLDIKLK